MTVLTKNVRISTKGNADMLNITEDVSKAVADSKLRSGVVTIFVPGATGAVSTIEYEPGLLKDFPRALERLAPSSINYEHHERWGCDNGSSHVRATLLGPSLTVPFVDGKLTLGSWQQIVFIDLDTRGRDRSLVLQIMGE